MRINEMERKVGIIKKNIRFYEKEGLLSPNRNLENGYREYDDQDVEILIKIKLLRKLAVPICEIKKIQTGTLTMEDTLRRHMITLEREQKTIEQMNLLCKDMADAGEQYQNMDTDVYLQKMEQMEKEGTKFMNITATDKKKKMIAPIVAAIVFISLMIGVLSLFIWGAAQDKPPIFVMVVCVVIPVAMIIGTIFALIQRMREIQGGEEDAASKY